MLSPACAITIRARVDPGPVSASSAGTPVWTTAFVCTITGAPVSIGRKGDRLEDPRHVADEAVMLDGALQKAAFTPGVVDPLADLAHEELRDRLRAAIAQEVRQLEERVDAARDDDVQVDRLVDALDPPDVTSETRSGRIDDRLDPGRPERAQFLNGVGDTNLLVPVARAPDMAVVLQRLGLQHEDVLVRQRPAQRADLDRPADRLDLRHLERLYFCVAERALNA